MHGGWDILWTSIGAAFIAQVLKVLVNLHRDRRLNFRYLVGAGGMPSSHSALVVSLAVGLALVYGTDSPSFAISVVLAIVVMYDAAGVRQAAGKQAKVLNQILSDWEKTHSFSISEERLKELLGHTPRQVLAGAVLGALVAFGFLG